MVGIVGFTDRAQTTGRCPVVQRKREILEDQDAARTYDLRPRVRSRGSSRMERELEELRSMVEKLEKERDDALRQAEEVQAALETE